MSTRPCSIIHYSLLMIVNYCWRRDDSHVAIDEYQSNSVMPLSRGTERTVSRRSLREDFVPDDVAAIDSNRKRPTCVSRLVDDSVR